MALISLNVDVYCGTTSDGPPIYRVFVDGELVTERSWTWPAYQVYIEENIVVNLEPGAHEVRVESLNNIGKLTAKNLRVNGHPMDNDDLTFITYS